MGSRKLRIWSLPFAKQWFVALDRSVSHRRTKRHDRFGKTIQTSHNLSYFNTAVHGHNWPDERRGRVAFVKMSRTKTKASAGRQGRGGVVGRSSLMWGNG